MSNKIDKYMIHFSNNSYPSHTYMLVTENNCSNMIISFWASVPKSPAEKRIPKKSLNTLQFPSEFCETFKDIYFAKHLRTGASQIWSQLEVLLKLPDKPVPVSFLIKLQARDL